VGHAGENKMSAAISVGSPEPVLSKRRLAWAGLAALIGCAAACSLPMLAVVFGGAGATAISSVVVPGAEAVVGGVAFAGALGLMAFRARAKRKRANEIPFACDPFVFSKDQRTEHHALAKNVFVHWPTKREELSDGYLLHYQGDEALFLNLAKWASSEHSCCAWATFSIEMQPFAHGTAGGIRLRMTGGAEGKAVIAEGIAVLENDPRPEVFLNPTGKITKESWSRPAKPSTGCGC
jgi:hypothetical protein